MYFSMEHGDKLTAGHVRAAAREYAGLEATARARVRSHSYVAVVNGIEYPPPVLVRLACAAALGIELTVDGGEHTACFRTLRRLGFDVVVKAGGRLDRRGARCA